MMTPDFVICSRVGEITPVPGSEYEGCTQCHTLIWVAPSLPAGIPRVCIQCAVEMLEKDGNTVVLAKPNAAQIEEVRVYRKTKLFERLRKKGS